MSTPHISKSTIGYVSVNDEELFNAAQLHQDEDTDMRLNPEHTIDALEERGDDDPPDQETLECHILDLIDSGAIDVGDMIQVNITRIDDE